MAATERVGRDPCGMAGRWNLDLTLVSMLLDLDQWACQQFAAAAESEGVPASLFRWPGLFVLSGHRTGPVVSALNPLEPPAVRSRHRRIPSLAADLRVGNTPASLTDPTIWGFLGSHWEAQGGRWGGRFTPPDWNHFDIDPLLAGQRPELPIEAFAGSDIIQPP